MNDIPHVSTLTDDDGAAPRPVLSVFDGAMIIVGIVIGAGIFIMLSMVAGGDGLPVDWMLTAWILGGVLSLIGALCYAELAEHFPKCGRRLSLSNAGLRTRSEFLFCMGTRGP